MALDPMRQLSESLKHVHNHGAKLYNHGRHAEAYRLYQGALFVALQMIEDRPDLKYAIADGLTEVEASTAADKLKAFRLHEVIEQTRSLLKSTLAGASEKVV